MSEIVWAISPQRDRFCELSRRMREFAEDVLVPCNIAFQLDVPSSGDDLRLDPEVRRQVFLIFKECIQNIARHSGCTEASAELTVRDGELVLRVADNGLGMGARQSGPRSSGGHGLANMRRRADSLNGSLDLVAASGEGFALVLACASE